MMMMKKKIWNAGICQAAIALFTELEIVIEMISIGTLLVFYLVSNALIYRRYVVQNKTHPVRTLLFLSLLSCSSIAFSISWKMKRPYCMWSLPLFGGLMISITALFQFIMTRYSPPPSPVTAEEDEEKKCWCVPLMPWPAAVSIFLNVFLMTTLKKLSYQRFSVWAGLITLFYVFYGVHSTYRAEEIVEDGGNVNTNTSSIHHQQEVVKL